MDSPDKHNWEIPEGVLCLWGFFSYDLEGLAAGAGLKKAEAAWTAPTSITGKSLKAFCAFGDFSVMTSPLSTGEGSKKSRPEYFRICFFICSN